MWHNINHNDLLSRGYELAYNFLFAVFPLLFFLVALLGMFVSESVQLRNDLFFYLQLVLPPAAYQLLAVPFYEGTKSADGGKLIFGLLFALYSGSAGMTQLVCTLNAAYEVREKRSWVKVHLISLGLTLAMSMLIIAALCLVLAGGQLLALLGGAVGLNAAAFIAGKVLQWALALALVVFAFSAIFYFAPDVGEQRWHWITPGSVVGVVLWATASAALRCYLHFFHSYSKTYGSLGAIMILMLWFYITGLSFLIGGQINATIEHAAAEQAHPQATMENRKAA